MQNLEETPPVKLNLYQKLLKIQQRVIGLGKNKDGYNYKYVTGEKVLEHIKPLMNEYGILLKQEITEIHNERQDYTSRNAPKTEILTRVKMRFTWVDCDSGQMDVNEFGANGQNEFEKGLGSALTYGERYFLLKYFHIATDEDDIDNPDRKAETGQNKPVETVKAAEPVTTPDPAQKPTNPATDKQKDLIKKLIKSSVFKNEERDKVESEVDNYTFTKASKIIEYLNQQLTERKKGK